MKKTLLIVLTIIVASMCMMPNVSVAKNSRDTKSVVQKTRTVKGRVKSPDGEPLIGVSVRAKGTVIIVNTNVDGSFSIQVPEGVTELEFSCVGFKAVTVTIPAHGDVDLTMEEETSLMRK